MPGNLEVHSRYAYDNAGRLQSITHSQSAIAAGETWTGTSTLAASLQGGSLLAGYYLTYDTDNRLTEWSSYYDAFKTTYSYDTRDQLAGATHTAIPGLTPPLTLPSAESYSFDGTGNRNLSGGGSSSATGTHNEVQNDGTYTYLYDNEGNQIRRTVIATGAVTEYEWDYRNRLIEVTDRTSAVGAATSVVTFQYDAFDRRTGKQVDSNADGTIDREEAWAWEGDQVALQLVDADGAGSGTWKLTNRYLLGDMVLADEQLPSGGIGLATVSATSGNVLWPLADHLGSVRDLVDSGGVIREHVVYDSFGNRLSESDFDASGNPIASNNPAAVDHLFGYTGREWDRDVDLQYNRARWFDPVQERWLSQDPIGFSAGDANLYRYVRNGATGAVDPSGLQETATQPLTPPVQNLIPKRWPEAGRNNRTFYPISPSNYTPATKPRSLDDWGLIEGLGRWTPQTFFAMSRVTPADTKYGCGGLMAMRVGLPKNKPWKVVNIKGGMAFGSLANALKYLQVQLNGYGIIVVAERGTGNSFLTIQGVEIGGDFFGPASRVNIRPASNYRTLLGTPDAWYWEHATGPWSSGGKVKHNCEKLSAPVFIVVPKAATRSPVPPSLLRPPANPKHLPE